MTSQTPKSHHESSLEVSFHCRLLTNKFLQSFRNAHLDRYQPSHAEQADPVGGREHQARHAVEWRARNAEHHVPRTATTTRAVLDPPARRFHDVERAHSSAILDDDIAAEKAFGTAYLWPVYIVN